MTAINFKVFNSADFGQIRVVMVGEKPWFVLGDIYRALDIQDSSSLLRNFGEVDSGYFTIGLPNGNETRLIVNERGLHDLAFIIGKPKAVSFARWVDLYVMPLCKQDTDNQDKSDENEDAPSSNMPLREMTDDLAKRLYDKTIEVVDGNNLCDKSKLAELRGSLGSIGFYLKQTAEIDNQTRIGGLFNDYR